MNLKITSPQASQSPVNAMHALSEQELAAIVGGLRVTITNSKGEKVVIDM
jgi:bacteriocin-like protein